MIISSIIMIIRMISSIIVIIVQARVAAQKLDVLHQFGVSEAHHVRTCKNN